MTGRSSALSEPLAGSGNWPPLTPLLQSEPVGEVLLGELQVGLIPAPAAVDGRELIDGRERDHWVATPR